MKIRSKSELQAAMRDLQNRMGEFYDKIGQREMTEDEKTQERSLTGEISRLKNELDMVAMSETEKTLAREQVNKNAQFREMMRQSLTDRQNREILLRPAGGNTTANIEASGAIELDIKDIIPTLQEGLGLPKGLNIVTGVTGDELYPVSIDDAEVDEADEVATLNDQNLNFSQIKVSSKRVGLSIMISRHAIENAAFDLLAFVQTKITLALRIFLAKKIYSPANFTGLKGPFAGLTPGTIDLGPNAYANILEKVGEFSDEGFFEGEVCISMSRKTEARLMATPKVAGAAAGFVVENGLCAGFPYTVSHYVNTKLNGDGKLVPDTDHEYFEIGYWPFFALQGHDTPSLIIDSNSAAVAKKNCVAVVFNSFWSLTDLSTKINGGKPSGSPAVYPTQAFALYEVTGIDQVSPDITLSQKTATVAVEGTKAITAKTVPAGASVTWISDDTSVATVSSGTITGVAPGTCNIIAQITVGGAVYQEKCKVTVTAA